MSSHSSNWEGSAGTGAEIGADGGERYNGTVNLIIPELRNAKRRLVDRLKRVPKIKVKHSDKIVKPKKTRAKRPIKSSLDKINIEKLVDRTWEQLTDEQRFHISDEKNLRLWHNRENPVKWSSSSSCLCSDCRPSNSTTVLTAAINGLVEDCACGKQNKPVIRRKPPPRKRDKKDADAKAAAAKRRRPGKPRGGKRQKQRRKPRVAKPKAQSFCFRPIAKPKKADDCPKKGKK